MLDKFMMNYTSHFTFGNLFEDGFYTSRSGLAKIKFLFTSNMIEFKHEMKSIVPAVNASMFDLITSKPLLSGSILNKHRIYPFRKISLISLIIKFFDSFRIISSPFGVLFKVALLIAVIAKLPPFRDTLHNAVASVTRFVDKPLRWKIRPHCSTRFGALILSSMQPVAGTTESSEYIHIQHLDITSLAVLIACFAASVLLSCVLNNLISIKYALIAVASLPWNLHEKDIAAIRFAFLVV